MPILADLNGGIIQTLDTTNGVVVNGKFVPAIPDVAPIVVETASYVLPVDGGDVSSKAWEALLLQFPMYEHALFNPLLTSADIADLDLMATFGSNPTRAAVGRSTGPLPVGQAPNRTRVLAPHPQSALPGVLVTDTININTIVAGGVDEVLVWWQLDRIIRTNDVTSSYGATADVDEPCLVTLTPASPEPPGFAVYASNDDGVTWYAVGYMSPTDLTAMGYLIRLAFVNTGNQDRTISGFGFLF